MLVTITADMLKRIAGAPGSPRVIDGLVEHLPVVLDEYDIVTELRVAHFLAQLAHESDHFRTMEEYASGEAYEGRKDLGNIRRGDGRRYKGRGPIQITGRYNYRKYGNLLGVDLENNPELAEHPEIGLRIAAEYWRQNDLNHWADKDNGKQITRKINGGYNGLNDRLAKIERAKAVLNPSHFHNDPVPQPVAPKPAPVEPVRVSAPVVKPVVESTPTPAPVVEPIVSETETTTLPLFVQSDLKNNA